MGRAADMNEDRILPEKNIPWFFIGTFMVIGLMVACWLWYPYIYVYKNVYMGDSVTFPDHNAYRAGQVLSNDCYGTLDWIDYGDGHPLSIVWPEESISTYRHDIELVLIDRSQHQIE